MPGPTGWSSARADGPIPGLMVQYRDGAMAVKSQSFVAVAANDYAESESHLQEYLFVSLSLKCMDFCP
jgi:hypothetical protein